MKLKQDIVDRLNNSKDRTLLALKIGVGENAVCIQLKKNKPFGRLTNQDALKAISEITGIDKDNLMEETEDIETARA